MEEIKKEEIKKKGESSIRALLRQLEYEAGFKIIDVSMDSRLDKFLNGSRFIVNYINFTIESSVGDPDGLSLGQKIIEIDRGIYPFLSNYVLNSKGKLRKVDPIEWSEYDYNIYIDKCTYEWGDNFEKNLQMSYVYVVSIYLDED